MQHDHGEILRKLARQCTDEGTVKALAKRLGLTDSGLRKWYATGVPLGHAQTIEGWPECQMTLEQICPHLEVRRLGGRAFVPAEQAAEA